MPDRPLFDLDATGKWRLAHDKNQWIIQKRTARGCLKGTRNGEPSFRGVWFVGSKKATLSEGFQRHSVELTDEARAQFNALPATFLEWATARRKPVHCGPRHPMTNARTPSGRADAGYERTPIA